MGWATKWLGGLLALSFLVACAAPNTSGGGSKTLQPPQSSWRYTVALDESLDTMAVALCIEGPPPKRIEASPEAMDFVLSASVRGGGSLEREGAGWRVEDLGEHGCLDLEIDVDAAADSGGRDCVRRGDTLMVPPDLWLWHPSLVPADVDVSATVELPPGVAMTLPWAPLDEQSEQGHRTYSIDASAFTWNAWVAFGRYEPLRFEVAGAQFEVAVLEGDLRASEAGIVEWLSASAEVSAELHGRFPRERVSVVVIPSRGRGDSPVVFGMVRRGGGASSMLLLDAGARDEELPGEWVAAHEFLHLGLPLIVDPWMSEGFVTYYTQIARARLDLLPAEVDTREPGESKREWQGRLALQKLWSNFDRGPSARTLANASAKMRELGGYGQVYWGGAAIALDLDLHIRRATGGRRSLDDLMRALQPLAQITRRWRAEEIVALMEVEVETWRSAGELQAEISPTEIVARHLRSRSIPPELRSLIGLAVDLSGGEVRLADEPSDDRRVREALFESRSTRAERLQKGP